MEILAWVREIGSLAILAYVVYWMTKENTSAMRLNADNTKENTAVLKELRDGITDLNDALAEGLGCKAETPVTRP